MGKGPAPIGTAGEQEHILMELGNVPKKVTHGREPKHRGRERHAAPGKQEGWVESRTALKDDGTVKRSDGIEGKNKKNLVVEKKEISSPAFDNVPGGGKGGGREGLGSAPKKKGFSVPEAAGTEKTLGCGNPNRHVCRELKRDGTAQK